jgi:hypothetical protein
MNKDWTGNKKSTFTTLGASSHSKHERQSEDYYATDPMTIEPLLEIMTKHNERIGRKIWENASGENHLSNKLEEVGYEVFSTDVVKRTDKTIQHDFLNDDINFRDYLNANNGEEITILTNPPYKYAREWVEKSMQILRTDEKLIMFLKLTFLEGQKRKELFEKYPPKYVFVFSKRQKCAMNGDFENTGSSASCYAWFVWQKGYAGLPTIDWA